jgi:TPR repeat protein|tara:strand:- start:18476 stop:20434 length:1959 start_codon:yes stop_codon:yes gene_type:complete
MNKIKVISLFLIVLLFASCANNNLQTNSTIITTTQKNTLISKANKGDIKAMIELNRVYLFPETKEGLELYNKWYPLVLKSDNAEDIMEFYPIFTKYKKMFINADEKYKNILETAVDLGSQKALYILSSHLIRNKQYDKLKKISEKIIKEKNQDKLITLHNIYLFTRQKDEAKKIEKLITKTNKEYFHSLSLNDKLFYTHLIYLQPKEKGLEYNEIIKDTITSNDPKLISGMANVLFDDARWYSAKAYLEKAVKLNNKDSLIHFNLANEYKIIDTSKHKYKEQIIFHLTKAALLDNYKATEQLLEIFVKEKNTQAYFDLKQKILKLNESKRALADFYYKQNRITEGDTLLNELAQKNNSQAIISLARSYKSKEFNPEKDALIDKWKNFVLNSDQVYLKEMLKPYLVYREDIEFKNKIIQKQIENNNITVLKELAKNTKFSTNIEKDEAIPYLQKAASFGDVESKYLLANKYNYYDKKESKKRIAIYNELIKQGDIKAYKELGTAYSYAPSGNTKEDVNKSLYYYKKAYENGDKSALEDIIVYYICPDCPTYNQEQGEIYINKAIEDKNANLLYRLGGTYKIGKIVKRDKKKAIQYYKKASELGSSGAYSALEDIYQNEKEGKNWYEKVVPKKVQTYEDLLNESSKKNTKKNGK